MPTQENSLYLNPDGLVHYNEKIKNSINAKLNSKVDKSGNKQLSDENFTSQYKTKLEGLSNYTLPTATSSRLGGVKIGSGLSVSSDGTISATGGGQYPTRTSQLINDSDFVASSYVDNNFLSSNRGLLTGRLYLGAIDDEKQYIDSSGKIYSSTLVVRYNDQVSSYVAPSINEVSTCGLSSNKWTNVYTKQVTGTGADYGEYFEYSDGNPNSEDRRGLFVTLDSDKISLAKENDDVLGIVSSEPLIIGDDTSDQWHGKFKKDVFGTYVLDENGKKILSENYDENLEYIGRQDRPEWDIVGLIGKLIMVDDGTCEVGKYCKPTSDGTGKACVSETKTKCKCMKRIDENHIKVFFG